MFGIGNFCTLKGFNAFSLEKLCYFKPVFTPRYDYRWDILSSSCILICPIVLIVNVFPQLVGIATVHPILRPF